MFDKSDAYNEEHTRYMYLYRGTMRLSTHCFLDKMATNSQATCRMHFHELENLYFD